MPKRKALIEVHGEIGTIDEFVEMTGYDRSTIYNKAKRAGLTVEQYLNRLSADDMKCAGRYEKLESDPYYYKGFPWDIRGCENLINAVFENEFKEMVDAVGLYLQKPDKRHKESVRYYEGWFRDALPNYREIDPEVFIKRAWEVARRLYTLKSRENRTKKRVL